MRSLSFELKKKISGCQLLTFKCTSISKKFVCAITITNGCQKFLHTWLLEISRNLPGTAAKKLTGNAPIFFEKNAACPMYWRTRQGYTKNGNTTCNYEGMFNVLHDVICELHRAEYNCKTASDLGR